MTNKYKHKQSYTNKKNIAGYTCKRKHVGKFFIHNKRKHNPTHTLQDKSKYRNKQTHPCTYKQPFTYTEKNTHLHTKKCKHIHTQNTNNHTHKKSKITPDMHI